MLERLTVDALAAIDSGRIKSAIETEIQRCEADCEDRPKLGKARKVTLTISITPVLDDKRDLDSCDVQFAVVSKLPSKESRVFNMRADDKGLAFNELAPDDARQRTIDEAETKGPRKVAT